MATFLFVTGTEYTPDSIGRSGKQRWSCSKTTRSGDRAFVYIKERGICYEWQAVSDAKPDKKWTYACNVKLVKAINPPIAISELKDSIPHKLWGRPRNNFHGDQSLKIDFEVLKVITGLRSGLIPTQVESERDFANAVSKSQKLSVSERQRRLKTANKKPEKREAIAIVYSRNPDVVAEVLYRAKGYCESCKQPAPFKKRSDKTPYLEVHHIKRLVDGGDDTVKNAQALCANCHRRKHFG